MVWMASFDVHIVGGGPAGCVCAREAARSGLKTLVSEEHSRVGEPVQCSGLISKGGLDSLGIDYSSAVLNEVTGARIFSPGMGEISVGNGEVRACVVDRTLLDRLLAEAAEKEGARIETGIRIARGSLAGKFVVGADGAGSGVASWFGFPKITEFAVCMQSDFEGVRGLDTSRIEMHLSNERFPGFFGWIIPSGNDSARVGLGAYVDLSTKKAQPVKRLFDDFISRKEISGKLDGAREVSRLAGIIPMKPRKTTIKGNVLLVGDAAGQVKATTGGGIVFGSAAARIAAGCIAAGKPLEYEAKWKEELGRDLELHAKLRAFLNSLSDERMESMFALAKLMGAEHFLNTFGEMDKPTKMVEKLRTGRYAHLYAAYSSIIG